MPTLEDMLRFEDEERERFVETYFPFEEVHQHYFPKITKKVYGELRADTTAALRQGAKVLVERQEPSVSAIYFLDIGELSQGDTDHFEKIVQKQLQPKYARGRYFQSYCHEVGGGYAAFLYNDSLPEFRKKFSAEAPHVYESPDRPPVSGQDIL